MQRQTPPASPRNDARRLIALRRGRIPLWLVLLVSGAVAGIFAVWYLQRPGKDGQAKRSSIDSVVVAADHAEEQILLAEALRELESLRVKKALDRLSQLEVLYAKYEWPGESSLIQQWKVVALLQAVTSPPDPKTADAAEVALATSPKAVEELLAACKQVQATRADKADTHLLLARVAATLKQQGLTLPEGFPDAPQSLTQAQTIEAQSPANCYEWVRLAEDAAWIRDKEVQSQARKATLQGHQQDPANLALLSEALLRTATEAPAELLSLLPDAIQAYGPLQKRILRQNKTDVIALLQEIQSKLAADPKANIMRPLRGMLNIVRLQDAHKSDLARVNRVPLEFLRPEQVLASGGFLPAGNPAGSSKDSPLPQLNETDATAKIQALLSELTEDISDLQVVDMNLDGKLDLVFLAGEKLGWIPSRREASRSDNAPWQFDNLQTIDLPPGRKHLLVADLDRDEVRRPTAKPNSTSEAGGDKPSPFTKREQQTLECEQAFPDLVTYGSGGMTIIRNVASPTASGPPAVGLGERRLVAIENPPLADPGLHVATACLIDFDHDSDLDLVTANDQGKLDFWLSLGNGTFQFESQTAWSILPEDLGKMTSLVAVDFDRDLDLDVIVAGPGEKALGLLENLRHGSFRWQAWGSLYPSLVGSQRVLPLEWDGNASWDAVGINKTGLQICQTHTVEPGKCLPQQVTSLPLKDLASSVPLLWQVGDLDNDTWLDFAWVQGNTLFAVSSAGGKLHPPVTLANNLPSDCRAMRLGDADGDGDLDVWIAASKQVVLLENSLTNEAHWLSLRLAGRADNKGRANNSGLGTLVELRTLGRYQAQVVSEQPVHFGLGDSAKADLVRLIFTNGVPQAIKEPVGDTQICERMELKGSCPFVYVWDGEKRVFFTDCLWGAPLGLQTTPDQTVPFRSTEFLKIPGNLLQPKRIGEDSVYELSLTEELWEAAYFDHVELLAIDHPQGTEIFSNEKVGPPSISEFKVHVVSQRQLPVAACNRRGEDCLAQILAEDEKYFRGFDQLIRQGLAEEHYLELNLGDLSAQRNATTNPPAQATLFLTGWIYPTDTSLNVALSQPQGDGLPRLPALWVPDGKGSWREAIPFTGFPGGKTKTIAIPLPLDLFPAGDYRVRVVTSAEIYWDAAFFSTAEETAVQVSGMPLVSATLDYHGFSTPLPRVENGPQRYDYQRVSREPKWPPMQGAFTRYGDVKPLVVAADDQMVVLGAGDEMVIRFANLKPVPEGYVRDFFLHSVGFDKDADLNTLDGQDALPLPFAAMQNYPPRAEDAWPESTAYQSFLKDYQTRRQSPATFWRALLTPEAR